MQLDAFMLILFSFACLIAHIIQLKNLFGFLKEEQWFLLISAYLLPFTISSRKKTSLATVYLLVIVAFSWFLLSYPVCYCLILAFIASA